MNKKLLKNFIICFLSVSIVLVSFSACSFYVKPEEIETVGEFKLEDYDYEWISNNYAPNTNSEQFVLGPIDSAEFAKEKAEEVWLKVYSGIYPAENDIAIKKPFKVYFDSENQVWLVEGTLQQKKGQVVKGGVPHILIQKSDGKVLAIWHDK